MSRMLFRSLVRNCSRLMDARLQLVSSRNMYSEQGLLPFIGPSLGQVCHSLIVVSNCTPGSALAQAALPMRSHSSLARRVLLDLRSVRRIRSQLRSFCTASIKLLDMRTELLAF